MAKTKKQKAEQAAAPQPAEVAPVVPVVPAVTAIATVKDQAAVDALYPDLNRVYEKKELTHRQRLFVEAYLADPEMNASRAAKKAGYRGATAGHALLRMHAVKREIEKKLRARRKKFEITAENLLQELAAIAFLDPAEMLNPETGEILPLADMPAHVRAAIRDVSMGYGENVNEEGTFDRTLFVKAAFHEKSWAAQILARHLGLLVDQSKQPGKASQVIDVDWDRVLFGEYDRSSDEVEQYIQGQERLAALPAPSTPVVVDAVPSSQVASNHVNGNGKANGPSPRKPSK